MGGNAGQRPSFASLCESCAAVPPLLTLGGKLFLDGVLRLQHIDSMKTAAVHSRIQPEIKEKAEGILQRLGLSPTEAIRMFYMQIALRNGLPFDVAIPNDETIKALEDSRNGRNLERFDSTDELFESWNA